MSNYGNNQSNRMNNNNNSNHNNYASVSSNKSSRSNNSVRSNNSRKSNSSSNSNGILVNNNQPNNNKQEAKMNNNNTMVPKYDFVKNKYTYKGKKYNCMTLNKTFDLLPIAARLNISKNIQNQGKKRDLCNAINLKLPIMTGGPPLNSIAGPPVRIPKRKKITVKYTTRTGKKGQRKFYKMPTAKLFRKYMGEEKKLHQQRETMRRNIKN